MTFTYVDDKTPVIKESLTFSDDRQKLDMSVTKLDAEDNTPIAGAVFGLYADEDIKNADGRVIIEKGTLLEKARQHLMRMERLLLLRIIHLQNMLQGSL